MDRVTGHLCAAMLVPACAWASGSAAAQAAPPPAAELFFQQPSLGGARLSPDGQSVALRMLGPKGRARLVVLPLKTREPTVVAEFGDADVDQFDWINGHRLVFDLRPELAGPGRAEFARGLFAVNADGSRFRQLVETRRAWLQAPDSGAPQLPWNTFLLREAPPLESDEVWVVQPREMSRDKTDYLTLLRLNTVTGRSEEVDTPLHSTAWTFDQRGELRAVVTREGSRMKTLWRPAGGSREGTWKVLAEHDFLAGGWLAPQWISPQGVLYATAQQGDKAALFTLDTDTGRRSERPVAASDEFDLSPRIIANRQGVLGLRYTVDGEVTQWLDPAAKALQARIDELLPRTANRLHLPWEGDSPWVLVEAYADVQPTLTFLYNTATRKLSLLGRAYPGIEPAQMGQTDFVRYPARDGLPIPAYLTLPPGGPRKGLPMVVLVHGGPWVRGASWRWDAEVQFLASRGYAVLQPEFRGSTGFGGRHFKAGWKQWGQAMQTDLADGARWAIAQGVADPRRICIAGASYGGYATLMGLVQNPELFRCGINWVGVSDIELMYSVHWSDLNNESKRLGMPRLIGDPVADRAMLRAASPLNHASQVKQPLLMAYGAWDVRVPLVHGEAFRDAVRPHNDQVEWVVYPDEGHGWARPATRIDFWTRVERFLARHTAVEAPAKAP